MAGRVARRQFTVQDFHRMGEAGILPPDERVELIDGVVVEMTPIGSAHAGRVNRLTALLGGPTTYIPKRPGEPDCTFADVGRIRERLHWSAKVSFEEGVRQMLAHIEDWRRAPVWTPNTIAEATTDWFRYLSPRESAT